ncbi:restriction endonuclease subunit S [Enterococcus raffinosus]|uniref:restriction endonuclease subunit S n=4 Tax=Enterococcus raffinosus TaxID=71452 RepID=UPI0007F3E3ED|nr:restriction endonuclease subunit S [Enterococcus raffinosus]SAZ59115.1 Type I restriction modification DNA specificity domain-containing protein [Enterococcus faecium]MDK7989188.1 restriction endonuclease subunit S [Enterococcus raffinosus]MDT2579179.1 restriction endonuclease subunit S [Enterococcus raffinosus]MDT2591540.1 restriction endonuclease subunit S [Enterococcus raffinosus]UXJ98178.1 restriction endonuclease subunit S [Enterococcus raffinosus]
MTKNAPELRFKGFTDDWEQRKLSGVIEKLSGGASIKPTDYLEDGIRTVPKGAVNATGIADLSGSKFISKDFFEKNITSHVHTNNLVTSLRDLVPSAPNMGRIVRIEGVDEQFLMPQGVYKLELFEGMDEDFLISFSNSDKYRKIISAEKNGSTQVHIRNRELLNIDINLPTEHEQQKIGTFFKQLDNTIDLHQRKLDLLKRLKQAYLQKMFPRNGEKVPEVRFADFDEKWEQRNLGEIADRYDNLRVPITASERVSGETPYYGANGIQDYVEGYTHNGEFILIAEDGANDLKNYPVNFVNGKIWVNNHAHVLQSKVDEADNKFLVNAINNINIEPFLVGGGRAKLNANVMMKLEVIIPSKIEQQKIGIFFKQIDNTITLHQEKINALKSIKKTFLNKMII